MSDFQVLEKRVGVKRRQSTSSPAPGVAVRMVLTTAFAGVSVSSCATSGTVTFSKTKAKQPGVIRWADGEHVLNLRPVPAEQTRVARDTAPASISDTAPKVLSESLAFAELVSRVLPIDAELDRSVEQALRARSSKRPARKLSAK